MGGAVLPFGFLKIPQENRRIEKFRNNERYKRLWSEPSLLQFAHSHQTSKAADLAPGLTPGAADQIGSVAEHLLLVDLQKPMVVDDSFACVDATHEVSERRIVYFESVTENSTRSGIK
jgi:hypothetical protein